MKILFSTTYYDPYVSGLSLYVKRLAEALARRRHQVEVICMQHELQLPTEEHILGVIVVRAKPLVRLSKGFLSFDFVRLAWNLVQHADVVIVNLPQFEGVWPALFARMQQKKLIAIYHCEVVLPDGFINSVIQSLLEVSHILTLLLANTVVTYTRDYAAHSRLLRILRSLRGPKIIQTIYPPIPKPVIRPALVAKLKKKIGPADIVIGVAARLAAEKGLEYLFEAIPLLLCHPGPRAGIQRRKEWIPGQARNDIVVKVVIAGPLGPVGEEVYKKKIMKLVARYKKYIVFLGTLSQQDMGSFYSLLDVLVLPSLNSTEAFGMVQVEAMLVGVPVVVSDLPGVRVPVQKTGMGILVPPRDSQGLARAIDAILTDKNAYVKKAALVARIFSLEKTIVFYEKLL